MQALIRKEPFSGIEPKSQLQGLKSLFWVKGVASFITTPPACILVYRTVRSRDLTEDQHPGAKELILEEWGLRVCSPVSCCANKIDQQTEVSDYGVLWNFQERGTLGS